MTLRYAGLLERTEITNVKLAIAEEQFILLTTPPRPIFDLTNLFFPRNHWKIANLKYFTATVVVFAIAIAFSANMSSMSSIFARLTRPFSSSTMRFGPEGTAGQKTMADYPEGSQKATVAAGCFWGVEHLYRHHFPKDALLDARVGYIGGDTESPSYRAVCTGRTGREFLLPMPG